MTERALLERIVDGRTDLVWDCVAQGHPATASLADGLRLVHWCAYYGDVSAIRFLLDRGESLATLGANLDLGGASFHGHWRLCEFLIESGADVNGADADTGETPLHAALSTPERHAHDLVVRVLLAHGADPNRATRPGAATGSFMRDCRTRGETPLHRAAAFGAEETLDLLLGAGASREGSTVNKPRRIEASSARVFPCSPGTCASRFSALARPWRSPVAAGEAPRRPRRPRRARRRPRPARRPRSAVPWARARSTPSARAAAPHS